MKQEYMMTWQLT